MTRSRRAFLKRSGGVTAAVVGGVGLAGCTSPFGESEPEPIDVDDAELEAIAALDVPSIDRTLPVDIEEAHLEAFRDLTQSLLDEIPENLADDVPNQAVREYIEEERESARDRLDALEETDHEYEQVRVLGSARSDAAEAEGAYAAAMGERDREEVYAEVEPVLDRRSELASELTRVGETPHHAVLVYDRIERSLGGVEGRLETVGWMAADASEVEAVGEAIPRIEASWADLETVAHLQERQSAAGDREFDDTFEDLARELLAELSDRAGDVPSDPDDAGELFDAPLEDTPRERVAEGLVRERYRRRPEEIREHLDDGEPARALFALYRLDLLLRTVDRMRTRVTDGGLDRPEDGDAVREAKEAALDEVGSVEADAEHPWLTREGLDAAVGRIQGGDHYIEYRGHSPENTAVVALGRYVTALEHARAVPATNEWFVDALS